MLSIQSKFLTKHAGILETVIKKIVGAALSNSSAELSEVPGQLALPMLLCEALNVSGSRQHIISSLKLTRHNQLTPRVDGRLSLTPIVTLNKVQHNMPTCIYSAALSLTLLAACKP